MTAAGKVNLLNTRDPIDHIILWQQHKQPKPLVTQKWTTFHVITIASALEHDLSYHPGNWIVRLDR